MAKPSLGSKEAMPPLAPTSLRPCQSQAGINNDVCVGVCFEGYPSGGSGRGVGNDTDCTPCMR